MRRWLEQASGQAVDLAMEGCTGWRHVVEEIERAGFAHVAEPAEAQARRGCKKRVTTDRSDARLLRQLLVEGRVLESSIPPTTHVLEARGTIRL